MRTLSRIADINQSIMPDRSERDTEKQIRAEVADHRRSIIRGKDPRGASKPSWRLKDARPGPDDPKPPAPPRFRVELNERNSIARLTQLSPDPLPSLDSHEKWTGRRFIAKIIEPCSVPEGSLPIGVSVDGFAEIVFSLVQSGKAEIVEEFAAASAP